jgi:hypothetical protein
VSKIPTPIQKLLRSEFRVPHCAYCHSSEQLLGIPLEVDHIIPTSLGGKTEFRNLCLSCRYPPYCSKYNPIERRLFAQVHRTIEKTIFKDVEQVKKLMEKTATKTGLSVEVRINAKEYPLAPTVIGRGSG